MAETSDVSAKLHIFLRQQERRHDHQSADIRHFWRVFTLKQFGKQFCTLGMDLSAALFMNCQEQSLQVLKVILES